MQYQAFPSGPIDTNLYIAVDPEALEAVIIDAPPNSAGFCTGFIRSLGLKPKMLLLTHSHWDHIADAKAIAEQLKIPIAIHRLDAENLRKPGSDGIPQMVEVEGVEPDVLLEEGQTIDFGGNQLKVIHTPGHCPGMCCFYEPNEHILFSGDTLFKRSIGILNLPTGEPDKMWESLKKLEALPPETIVLPGHGPETTIGDESWLPRAQQIFGR